MCQWALLWAVVAVHAAGWKLASTDMRPGSVITSAYLSPMIEHRIVNQYQPFRHYPAGEVDCLSRPRLVARSLRTQYKCHMHLILQNYPGAVHELLLLIRLCGINLCEHATAKYRAVTRGVCVPYASSPRHKVRSHLPQEDVRVLDHLLSEMHVVVQF